MTEIGYQTGALAGWSGYFAETPEENPDLVWPQSINVYDRMRREDPQVRSVLSAVMLPIQQIEWTLDDSGVRPEVAALVSADLGIPLKGKPFVAPARTKGRFSWVEHVRLALLELVFGHSVFEQVYEIDAFGLTHLKKLAYRPPRTISKFEIERDGGLSAIHQWGFGNTAISGGSGVVRIPVDRVTIYVHEREGSNWIGVSLLRAAYKMWLLKDRTLRVQALAAERQGLGLSIYTSAPPPDEASYDDHLKWLDLEIERGLGIAKGARAGETAGAALPHGATLEFKGVAGKLPDLDKQIRYYDEQIGRVALTHFLNLGGDDSTGSYALGDTFANFFTASLNAIAQQLTATAQQHVVEDLVDANWGPNEPAPRLVAARIGAEHPATAEAIRALLESGAIKWDPALEAHLRSLYGLPVADLTQSDDVAAAKRAAAARAAAEVAQKAYLATEQKPLTRREARALIAAAGAEIDIEAPEPKQEAAA